MDYRFIVGVGSSMIPTYRDKYYLILINTSVEPNVNDVVAYQNDGKKVHRVVGVCDTMDEFYYTVKPDAYLGYYNYVSIEDIYGVVVYALPIPIL